MEKQQIAELYEAYENDQTRLIGTIKGDWNYSDIVKVYDKIRKELFSRTGNTKFQNFFLRNYYDMKQTFQLALAGALAGQGILHAAGDLQLTTCHVSDLRMI